MLRVLLDEPNVVTGSASVQWKTIYVRVTPIPCTQLDFHPSRLDPWWACCLKKTRGYVWVGPWTLFAGCHRHLTEAQAMAIRVENRTLKEGRGEILGAGEGLFRNVASCRDRNLDLTCTCNKRERLGTSKPTSLRTRREVIK